MIAFLTSVSWIGWLIIAGFLIGLAQVPRLIRNAWTGEREREALRAKHQDDLPPTYHHGAGSDGPDGSP